MKAETFTGCNALMKGPENWDEKTYGPCADLPVAIGNGLVLSCWRPTPAEAALLMGGGLVLLTVVGEMMPPVQIEVVHARDARADMARA